MESKNPEQKFVLNCHIYGGKYPKIHPHGLWMFPYAIGHVLAKVKTQIQIILAECWCNFSWVENILNPAKKI